MPIDKSIRRRYDELSFYTMEAQSPCLVLRGNLSGDDDSDG